MNSSSQPDFRLRLFGTPAIERGGGGLLSGRVAQRHRLAVLALLALAPARRLSRDKLIAYLWPESDADRARNLLNVATYNLRASLGEAALLSAGDDLQLNGDILGVDVTEFEVALQHGDYPRAAAMYRAPFLDGFFLSDAPEFERWVDAARKRLADAYGTALEALAAEAEGRSDFGRAAEWWKTRAMLDPYDSRVATRLMQALEGSGNRAGALQHAAVHERLLQEEFGIRTAPEVSALAGRLRKTPAPPPSPILPPRPDAAPVSAAQPAPANRRLAWGGGGGALLLLAALVAGALRVARTGDERPRVPDHSIAVLPFVNMSADSGNEYFSDGLTEEVITRLAAVGALKVISRTSVMHYKRSTLPLRQIAQELGVAHVLEGSARESGGRVRVSAQLIDARSDQHLWAHNYDTERRDVVQVQEQIARAVVTALELQLAEGQTPLASRGTNDPEAYRLYQRGRYLWNTRTRDGHARAIEYYRQAIARDSSYADAYAGMAFAYSTAWQLNLGSLAGPEVLSRVKWAAERALALDDQSTEAHTAVAMSLLWQHNWPGAGREFRRAIELNPGNSSAHTWYGLLLAGMDSSRAALEESRRAYEVDPFAVVVSGNLGWQYYLARDYDRAIEQHRKTVEIAPAYGRGTARLGMAYALQGQLHVAEQLLERAITLDPYRPDFIADLAYVQARLGKAAAAREGLERAKARPFEPFNIGRAYVALGNADSAFAWLERSTWQFPHRAVLSDPALDPIRGDPRFARLRARIARDMGIR
jgi:serine/threonine-protein kinase